MNRFTKKRSAPRAGVLMLLAAVAIAGSPVAGAADEPVPVGQSQGSGDAGRTSHERANISLVLRIYNEVLTPLNASAVDAIVAPGYIQHNPAVQSGAEGLKQMLTAVRQKYQRVTHVVKRMAADGDLVFAHVNVVFEPGTRGVAVVDIFRIADGKIAEHWDVLQAVPETSVSGNPIF